MDFFTKIGVKNFSDCIVIDAMEDKDGLPSVYLFLLEFSSAIGMELVALAFLILLRIPERLFFHYTSNHYLFWVGLVPNAFVKLPTEPVTASVAPTFEYTFGSIEFTKGLKIADDTFSVGESPVRYATFSLIRLTSLD